MNMRTFHKLSQEILNEEGINKQNQILNLYQIGRTRSSGVEKGHISKEQIINMKKMNAKKIQQINVQNEKNIYSIKQNYQKEKNDLVQKYQKILIQKQEYIKLLEDLCSDKQQKTHIISNYSNQNHELPKYLQRQNHNNPSIYKINDNSLYTHQAPLFNDLCFSIQRPTQLRKQKNDFCSSKRIKSRVTSNQKSKKGENQNSVSSSKYRSQSSTRNSASRHGLAPACPPKYCKVL